MAAVNLSTSPWLIRIIHQMPLPLPVLGLSTAIVHFLLIALLALWLHPALGEELMYRGWQNPHLHDYRMTLGIYVGKSLLFGYLVIATYYGLRGAVSDFQSLRPALSCNDTEFDDWLNRLRQVPRLPLHIASVVAVIGPFFAVQQESNWASLVQPPPLGSARMTFSQIDAIVLAFFLFRVVALEFISATVFAQVAHRYARIELLDLEQIAPFSRRSLRAVLVLVLFMVIQSAQMIFEPNPPIGLVIYLGLVALAVFLIPLIPLQRRIYATKQKELARIRTDIIHAKERILEDDDWTRLSGLIVYKQALEQVNTWAFNTPTVVRFGFYLAVGIGSWIGAAFVERLLGALLGS